VRVPQRLDYTLRLLTAIALEAGDGPVVAGELAHTLGMPKRFLEQQITVLAKADLVTCRRGGRGGCTLARPAAKISVADVARVIEGGVLDIPRTTGSAVAEMWAEAESALSRSLTGVTLADLARRQAEIESAAAQDMYYI
jgi:Rrf2 family protein